VLYLFRGQDLVALREAVAALCEGIAVDPSVRDLNVTRLDGDTLSVADLSTMASTWPFLAERRVVLVEGLSRSCEPRGGEGARPAAGGATPPTDPSGADVASEPAAAEEPSDEPARGDVPERLSELEAFLRSFQEQTSRPVTEGGLPCDLVLVEAEIEGQARRRAGFRRPDGLALLTAMVERAGGQVRVFARPRPRDVGAWIRERARAQQVTLDDDAAELLAVAIGPRTELLEMELAKLATYADGQPISADDVRLLVAEARAVNVFDLGDLVAAGDRAGALALLERLRREGEHPLRILQLLVRHFRLLVEAHACASAEEFARRARLPSWPAEKTWRQAQRVAPGQVRAALAALLAADAAIKQGRCEPDEALLLALLRLNESRASVPRHRSASRM
jgi:DNA polymerase-3 subunit delta